MNDLTPEDRALLDRARDGHEPSAADRQRVRRMLGASLGAAAGLATTTAVGTSVAAGAGAASIATKLVVVAVVAAAAGAGGAAAYLKHGGQTGAPAAMAAAPMPAALLAKPARPPSAAAPTITDPLALAPRAREEPLAREQARAREEPRAREESAEGDAPPPRAARPVPRPRPPDSAPRAVSRPTADAVATPAFEAARPSASFVTPLPTTIEAETRLLRDGVAALHAGDPSRALALFDEHARRYANGVLAEERSAERVFALHDLGRVAEASQAAAAFLRDHPSSPLGSRVRAACAPAPNR